MSPLENYLIGQLRAPCARRPIRGGRAAAVHRNGRRGRCAASELFAESRALRFACRGGERNEAGAGWRQQNGSSAAGGRAVVVGGWWQQRQWQWWQRERGSSNAQRWWP